MAGKGKPGPLTKEQATQRKADIWHAIVHESLTQKQAADRFGLTPGRVSQILAEAAGEITQATAESIRKAQLDRLARMRQAALAVVERHQVEDDPTLLAALDRLLKIEQREAALTGADAPQVVETRQYDYRVNGVDESALK